MGDLRRAVGSKPGCGRRLLMLLQLLHGGWLLLSEREGIGEGRRQLLLLLLLELLELLLLELIRLYLLLSLLHLRLNGGLLLLKLLQMLLLLEEKKLLCVLLDLKIQSAQLSLKHRINGWSRRRRKSRCWSIRCSFRLENRRTDGRLLFLVQSRSGSSRSRSSKSSGSLGMARATFGARTSSGRSDPLFGRSRGCSRAASG